MDKQIVQKNFMAMGLTVLCTAAHGLSDVDRGLELVGIATLTALTANDITIENEYFASFDISRTWPVGDGQWSIMIEANTTPQNGAVSTFLPDANNDVGSALDGKGQGRLQLSGLHFDFEAGKGQWEGGLLNAADYIDASFVANDEKTQFLNSDFVNNPTIALPDYCLGLFYYHPATSPLEKVGGWLCCIAYVKSRN